MTAPSLLAELARDLQQHAPFDAMPAAEIQWLIQRLGVRYYPLGSIIMSAGTLPDGLFIVRRGTVKSEDSARNAALHALVDGELFPLGALLGQRPTLSTFRAETDCFCYYLTAADFHELRSFSHRFQDFCTRRIAHLLDLSRQRLQTTYASHVVTQTLDIPLKEVAHLPITCLPDTSLKAVLQTMRHKRIGSMVVVDEGGQAKGIFTLHDLLRITLEGVSLADPIAQHMSARLVHLPSWHRAFDAAVTMARHGIHHLLVIDDEVLTGIVSERDLFGLQRVSLNQLAETIAHAETEADLSQIHRDLYTLQRNMLAQGVSAGQLSRGIAALTDALLTRLITLAKPAEIEDESAFAWMATSAHGRQEITVACEPELVLLHALDAALVTAWQTQFATLCQAAGWKDYRLQVNHMHHITTAIGDCRWLAGNLVAVQAYQETSQQQQKLRCREEGASIALAVGQLTASEPTPSRTLLAQATDVFVRSARLLGTLEGLPATGTVERLTIVGERLRWPSESLSAWIEAFQFLWLLPLANPSDSQSDVMVYALNELDQRILKEALRQARKLAEFVQQRLMIEPS